MNWWINIYLLSNLVSGETDYIIHWLMQTSSVDTACNYEGIRCVAFSCMCYCYKISLIFVNANKCNTLSNGIYKKFIYWTTFRIVRYAFGPCELLSSRLRKLDKVELFVGNGKIYYVWVKNNRKSVPCVLTGLTSVICLVDIKSIYFIYKLNGNENVLTHKCIFFTFKLIK